MMYKIGQSLFVLGIAMLIVYTYQQLMILIDPIDKDVEFVQGIVNKMPEGGLIYFTNPSDSTHDVTLENGTYRIYVMKNSRSLIIVNTKYIKDY